MYFVYILKCADNTLYTGITTEVTRRVEEHNSSDKGAKYTKNRRPVELVYEKEYRSRVEACREEYRIKKLSRKEKFKLLNN